MEPNLPTIRVIWMKSLLEHTSLSFSFLMLWGFLGFISVNKVEWIIRENVHVLIL